MNTPDHDPMPWPQSLPDHLGGPGDARYEAARDKERRQLITNVRYLSARVEVLSANQKTHDATLAALRKELADNTELTNDIKELLSTARAGIRVLGWLGGAVKWLGALASAALAIWGFMQLLKLK